MSVTGCRKAQGYEETTCSVSLDRAFREHWEMQCCGLLEMIKRNRTSGRPTKEDAELLSTMVLAAARAAFLEYGFKDASMSDIAARIGAAKPTIYKRYESKEVLLVAMIDAEVAKLERFVRKTTFTSGPTLESLKAASWLVFEYTAAPEELAFRKLLYGEAATKPLIADRVLRWLGILKAPFEALVAKCQEAGHITSESSSKYFTDLLFDMISGPLDRIALATTTPELEFLEQTFSARWRSFERVVRP